MPVDKPSSAEDIQEIHRDPLGFFKVGFRHSIFPFVFKNSGRRPGFSAERNSTRFGFSEFGNSIFSKHRPELQAMLNHNHNYNENFPYRSSNRKPVQVFLRPDKPKSTMIPSTLQSTNVKANNAPYVPKPYAAAYTSNVTTVEHFPSNRTVPLKQKPRPKRKMASANGMTIAIITPFLPNITNNKTPIGAKQNDSKYGNSVNILPTNSSKIRTFRGVFSIESSESTPQMELSDKNISSEPSIGVSLNYNNIISSENSDTHYSKIDTGPFDIPYVNSESVSPTEERTSSCVFTKDCNTDSIVTDDRGKVSSIDGSSVASQLSQTKEANTSITEA